MANVPFFFEGERKIFIGLAAARTDAFAAENPGAFFQEIGGNLYESNGSVWNTIRIGGAGLVYGLARNMVKRVPADGAYTATETFGMIISKAPTLDDTAITPVGGSAVTAIKAATFTVGQCVPLHASSVTVGTGGEFLLFIP